MGETPAMEPPDIRYARSGDLAIAYQTIGEGPLDVVFCPFNPSVFYLWEITQFASLMGRLAKFSRLILFDHRGTGLSDRPRDLPTLEARMDDIRTVMDAVESEQAGLVGVLEGGHLTTLFAATYPERTSALILFNPSARGLQAPDYPWGLSNEEWRARLKEIREGWGSRELSDKFAASMYPSLADDEEFLRHFLAYTRLWASPGAAHAYFRMAMETDVRDVLPAVRVPLSFSIGGPFVSRASTSRVGFSMRRRSWFRGPMPGSSPATSQLWRSSVSSFTRSRRPSPNACSRPFSSPTSSVRPSAPRSLGIRAGSCSSSSIMR
jgi:pimeloyl-ACP methyl ester carboxylesterase